MSLRISSSVLLSSIFLFFTFGRLVVVVVAVGNVKQLSGDVDVVVVADRKQKQALAWSGSESSGPSAICTPPASLLQSAVTAVGCCCCRVR